MLLPLGILASAGGVNAAYELISTTVLGSTSAQVDFSVSSYSATYKHLQIRAVARCTAAAAYVDSRIRFNNDTGANYSFHEIYGYGTGIASGNGVSQTNIAAAYFAGANSTANNYGTMIMDLLDVYSTSKNKTTRSFSGITEGASSLIDIRSGAWLSTASATTVSILPTSGSFAAGSRFSLYGIKG